MTTKLWVMNISHQW